MGLFSTIQHIWHGGCCQTPWSFIAAVQRVRVRVRVNRDLIPLFDELFLSFIFSNRYPREGELVHADR